jgi:O-antigen/teichoic acid export membrane protein
MESPSSIFYARCVASVVSLAIGVPLTKAYGLLGVMWGIVLANAAAFVMTMYFLRGKLAAAEPPTGTEPHAV